MELNNLAIFGGIPAFKRPRSTSNLVRPNQEAYLGYIKQDYENGNLSSESNLILRLEDRLAKFHDVKNCVSVCNGLWGLVLTINELRLKGKIEIVMPSLTYRRMADIAAWLNLIPHFCDVDPHTFAISPETAGKCINENTALILAPHPIVHLNDIDGMIQLAKKYNLPLIFDPVEAAYAVHNGQAVGSFGDAECYSVHASKFYNGFEGGYITTNDSKLAKRLKAARKYGIDGSGNYITSGINGNLISLHAAMVMAALDDVEDQVERNKKRFYKYEELLREVEGMDLVKYSEQERRSFKNILVRLNDKWPLTREETLDILQKENMVVRPYYYPPLHLKPSIYPTITGEMKNTELLMNNYMLLPCGEFVDENDIEVIVDYIKYLGTNSIEITKAIRERPTIN
jgi:dTDP-4-amino-4,6-dideoxygalactose transaminase